ARLRPGASAAPAPPLDAASLRGRRRSSIVWVGKAPLFAAGGPPVEPACVFEAYHCEHDDSTGSCPGTPARDQLPGVRAPSRPVGSGGHAQTHRIRRAAAPARLAVQRPEPAAAVPGQLGAGIAGAIPAAVRAAARRLL